MENKDEVVEKDIGTDPATNQSACLWKRCR